ncbi:WD40 repeat-like protein [Calocera cornea HHB12733]|uniref:WD40 repeat-like protein n=1 Tax=Calocera cornea HHB12733 TaxID=1353952 RepID=A0A165ELA0_9BASI|nr:WD40 repeat-like protein [Calocera cornea HHB12733]
MASTNAHAHAHAPEETSLTAPEGIYHLTDDVKPPVLHSQIVNSPNLYPSRLTTITVSFPARQATQGLAALLRRDRTDKQPEVEQQQQQQQQQHHPLPAGEREADESVSDEEHESDSDPAASSDAPPPTPGLFAPPAPAPLNGKKKPAARTTHNIRSTSSSFVTRIHTTEGLTKHLASKSGDVTFAFYNGAKSFFWYELGAGMKEPLARVTFAAFPTCHDINRHTSGSDALDLLIGFNTGDIMWYDPLSSRYVRINKGGCMTTSPITCVRWVPGHRSMFLAAHADGTINVYDKEREDGNFGIASTDTADADAGWNALEDMIVVRPPPPGPPAKGEKEKQAKNPVSHWRICRRAITDFSFSPDMRYLATTSEDGCLRIIDPSAEKLLDTYSSYFGSLTSCAWTPDSRHLATGGQDDLVSLFSLREQRLLARCQGHSSFVVAVAVDPARCDGRTIRFGSVGEDKHLVLWDFVAPPAGRQRTQTLRSGEKDALAAQPQAQDKPTSRYHPAPPRALIPVIYPSMPQFATVGFNAMSLSVSLPFAMPFPISLSTRFNDASNAVSTGIPSPLFIRLDFHSTAQPPTVRNADRPAQIVALQGDILSSLAFVPHFLLTVTRPGWVKSWQRPPERAVDMTAEKNALFARKEEAAAPEAIRA